MFKLSIRITMSLLDITKLALTKALPDVKSSHRCEAMARGFGYRTHASFLEDARSNKCSIATVDGAAFRDYLAQHDFNVLPSELYRAAAKASLCDIAERFPKLTVWGFGTGGWDSKTTPTERRKNFADNRARLVSDYAVQPFLSSLAFVSRVERTKTIRPNTSSYRLKHIAEKYRCTYPEGEKLGPVYVANGVLIAAAIHAGFDVKPYTDDYGTLMLNAGFNMAKASLSDLDCEIRPNGACAQSRRERERQRSYVRLGVHLY